MKAVYGIPETDRQYIGRAPSGAVLMDTVRPSTLHTCSTGGCAEGSGKWILDPEVVWIKDMEESDKYMPRHIEELWDVIGIENAPTYTQGVYNQKKAKRAEKPLKE